MEVSKHNIGHYVHTKHVKLLGEWECWNGKLLTVTSRESVLLEKIKIERRRWKVK